MVHVRHLKYCHFTAALHSYMSLHDCAAVEVDGATTKMRCEKKSCENMSHELLNTCLPIFCIPVRWFYQAFI